MAFYPQWAFRWTAWRLSFGLVGGLVFGLFSGLLSGLLGGLLFGLLSGLIVDLGQIQPKEVLTQLWEGTKRCIAVGLLIGLVVELCCLIRFFGLGGLLITLWLGLVLGLPAGLFGGLVSGLLDEDMPIRRSYSLTDNFLLILRYIDARRIVYSGSQLVIKPKQGIHYGWHGLPEGLFVGLVFGHYSRTFWRPSGDKREECSLVFSATSDMIVNVSQLALNEPS